MCVLLGLGGVQLADAMLREHVREHHLDRLLGEDDREVEVVPVARHRRQVDAELAELLRQLPRSVGPEVEEDGRVPVGTQPRPAPNDRRQDEFIRDTALVAVLDGCDRIVGLGAFAI